MFFIMKFEYTERDGYFGINKKFLKIIAKYYVNFPTFLQSPEMLNTRSTISKLALLAQGLGNPDFDDNDLSPLPLASSQAWNYFHYLKSFLNQSS